MSPRPSINKAYSMIISEESRRALSQSSQVSEVNEGTILFGNKGTSSEAPVQLNAKENHRQNHSFLGNEVTTLFSSKGNAGASYGHSGAGNHSVSGYRSIRNNLHCHYYNFKGHTRETCYKLNGYPQDFKSKIKGEFGNTVNYAQTNDGNYMSDTSTGPVQAGSTANFAGVSQYNQILQLLGKQPECSGSAMAADSGASSHMVNNSSLKINVKVIGNQGGKVHLPTGSVAHELFSGQVRGIGREEDGLYVFNSTPKKSVALQAQNTLQKLNGSHDFMLLNVVVKTSIVQVPTYDRKRYFLTLVDDCSRYTWLFLLPTKVEVVVALRSFFTMIKNVYSTSVKFFRSDNGCEFFNSHMSELLQSLGIIHQSSCIYTPQQNRVAERRHRYILEVARALRFQASVPLRFWGECVSTAVYIINRLPSIVLHKKSPFEIMFGHSPSLQHM
uniref:Integrase catalytic domain-containing protein n=1 Tax=Nicotiana tabacum TaxID=4097 RepID=A0A1S4B8Z1_TOBAC|nr:PREDICTED: uncharacterized protein LOC107805752 [Nicotiana tabacum]